MKKRLLILTSLVLIIAIFIGQLKQVGAQSNLIINKDNVTNLELTRRVKTNPIEAIELQQDHLFVGFDTGIALYDLSDATFKPYTENRGSKTNAIALHPHLIDGNSVAYNSLGTDIIRVPHKQFYSQYSAEASLKLHTSTVTALTYDTSGNLYSGNGVGEVIYWVSQDDLARSMDGTPILQEYTSGVNALAVNTEGRLAVGRADGSIQIWQPNGIQEEYQLNADILQLIWHPTEADILAFVLENGQSGFISSGEIIEFPVLSSTAIAWSPTDNEIALGQIDGSIVFLDASSLEPTSVLEQHLAQVTDIAWTSNYFISSGQDGNLFLWDLETSTSVSLETLQCCVVDIRSDYNSAGFVYVLGKDIMYMDVANNELYSIYSFDEYHGIKATISSSGRYIAFFDDEKETLIFLEETGRNTYDIYQVLAADDLPFSDLFNLVFSPDESHFFITDLSENMAMLTLPDFSIEWQRDYAVSSRFVDTHFSPTSTEISLVTQSSRGAGVLVAYDTYSGDTIAASALGKRIYATDYTNTSNLYLTSSDGLAEIWDLDALRIEEPLIILCEDNADTPLHAVLSADDSMIFCAGTKLDVRDVETNDLIVSFDLDLGDNLVYDIWLGNNGSALFVVTSNEIQRWEVVD